MTNKNGKSWLKAAAKTLGVWHEPDTNVFARNSPAHLVTADGSQSSPSRLNDDTNTRRELRSTVLLDLLWIELRARDNRTRKIVVTWISCRALQGLIVRAKPTRHGIGGHDRYSAVIQLLQRERLVTRDANGWRWCGQFTSLKARADWLMELAREKGGLRAHHGSRYTLVD